MELESGTSTNDVAADSAFERVFERLYGKMTFEEKLRLIWLAGTLFFIIGGYWLLRSLKDPVIATICGVEYIPKAKMLSVLVVLVLVFVYNKLIDMFPKHQLFYIVGGFYAGLFTLIACLLAAPATAQTSIYNTNASPYRLIGWISYCSIESFGSIGVSLFWAFTNSTYNLEGAKKAYGLMVACAQLGSIAGPTLVSVGTEAYGVPTIYFCGALCMVAMVLRRRPLSFLSHRVARWRGGSLRWVASTRAVARLLRVVRGEPSSDVPRPAATPAVAIARPHDGVPESARSRGRVDGVPPTLRRSRALTDGTHAARRDGAFRAGRLHLRLQPALPPAARLAARVDEEEVVRGHDRGPRLVLEVSLCQGHLRAVLSIHGRSYDPRLLHESTRQGKIRRRAPRRPPRRDESLRVLHGRLRASRERAELLLLAAGDVDGHPQTRAEPNFIVVPDFMFGCDLLRVHDADVWRRSS